MGYQCRGYLTAERNIAPDWGGEVPSPATRKCDLKTKRKLYTGCGVVYWVLDPKDNTLVARDDTETRYSASDTATVSGVSA
jgi:Uma2 family endonuclease